MYWCFQRSKQESLGNYREQSEQNILSVQLVPVPGTQEQAGQAHLACQVSPVSLSTQTTRNEIHSFLSPAEFQLICEGKFCLTGLLGVVVGIAVLSDIHLVHTS